MHSHFFQRIRILVLISSMSAPLAIPATNHRLSLYPIVSIHSIEDFDNKLAFDDLSDSCLATSIWLGFSLPALAGGDRLPTWHWGGAAPWARDRRDMVPTDSRKPRCERPHASIFGTASERADSIASSVGRSSRTYSLGSRAKGEPHYERKNTPPLDAQAGGESRIQGISFLAGGLWGSPHNLSITRTKFRKQLDGTSPSVGAGLLMLQEGLL